VQILRSRAPLYAKADITVDTTATTPQKVIEELQRALPPPRPAVAPHYATGR
jgi:hypothetical protein